MPRRELKHPHQVENWLMELAQQLTAPAKLILIGSGGLLWHAAQRGLDTPLPENSMDVDPVTDSDEVARHCYDAVIGSDDHGIDQIDRPLDAAMDYFTRFHRPT